jgi:hypothetical protein
MKVTFIKRGERQYGVHVERERAPDLRCGSIGYDDWLPHDLLHFVAEAEYGLDGAIFGDLAAGGNARLFVPEDPALVAKMWRRQRIKPTKLPDGRRSEELAWELHRRWRAKALPTRLQARLDALAAEWHALQVGGSLSLEWPRPEGRKRGATRDRRRPAATRRR